MLSAEDIATVKVAVEICNNPQLKREILRAPGSEYDKGKRDHSVCTSRLSCHFSCKTIDERKTQWDEIVEKKAKVMLKSLVLPEKLQEKAVGIALSVGMRMLFWAEYHERTIGFSRDYSMNFLNSSLFTQRGIINCKKTAEELIKDSSLSIKQKYKLACLYCFTDHIHFLFRHITKEDMEEFCDDENSQMIDQLGLVQFWTYFLLGKIDELKGDRNLDAYRLERAIESGNKAAVQYCLERESVRRKRNILVNSALGTVQNIMMVRRNDWIIFKDRGSNCKFQTNRYSSIVRLWIPSDYYVDILYFLLSKMNESQQTELLKKDFLAKFLGHPKRSRVLECFLNWPYQDCFMKTAQLMWTFLPKKSFEVLLLIMCNKIETENTDFKYGEGKNYNYRKLLKEFWCQSPVHYKRYVLKKHSYNGRSLLIQLFTLMNFTYDDRENIALILNSVTNKDKEDIIYSREGVIICRSLMAEEKWRILDEFISNCLVAEEERVEFKRKFSFRRETEWACYSYFVNRNWNAAESFIRWSSLPEEEIIKLKGKMIYPKQKWDGCIDLISFDKKVEVLDKYIKWCIIDEEKRKAFKKKLIFSYSGICKCTDLIIDNQLDLVDEFISLCLSSHEEIRELKKNINYKRGSFICKKLISGYPPKDMYEKFVYENFYYKISQQKNFCGGRWEEVEKFLTWCFSSEEEIMDFKKNTLLKNSGKHIVFYLIGANQWTEAETFFSWLELSSEEIKQVKKETLYDVGNTAFSYLMQKIDDGKEFSGYGSRQEAIELFLRWYLTDKETVIEFKDHFQHHYDEKRTTEDCAVLKDFNLAIEQHLNDLDEEKRGVKRRKFETFPPNKKLCN